MECKRREGSRQRRTLSLLLPIDCYKNMVASCTPSGKKSCMLSRPSYPLTSCISSGCHEVVTRLVLHHFTSLTVHSVPVSFFNFLKNCCLSTIVSISPHPLSPPQPSPLPTLDPIPFGFVHVSFVGVPENC